MATTAQDVSYGLPNAIMLPQSNVVDPSTQLKSPSAGPGAQNPRKRRASGQPPAPIAPAPTPVQYGDQQPVGALPDMPTGELGQQGQPTPKKGRTNTPWTPAEEQRLKQMRDQGKSWSEIAKTFPNRTEGSVKKHWYKVSHFPFYYFFCSCFICQVTSKSRGLDFMAEYMRQEIGSDNRNVHEYTSKRSKHIPEQTR